MSRGEFDLELGRVYGFFRVMCLGRWGGDVDVDDLVGEVMLRALERWDRWDRGMCRLETWLMGIGKNVVRDMKRRGVVYGDLDVGVEDVDLHDLGKLEGAIVLARGDMGDRYREVMDLWVEGMSHGDISREVGLKNGGVSKFYLNKGRRRVYAKLVEIMGEGFVEGYRREKREIVPVGEYGHLRGEKEMVDLGLRYIRGIEEDFEERESLNLREIGILRRCRDLGLCYNFARIINRHELVVVRRRWYLSRKGVSYEDILGYYREYRDYESRGWSRRMEEKGEGLEEFRRKRNWYSRSRQRIRNVRRREIRYLRKKGKL